MILYDGSPCGVRYLAEQQPDRGAGGGVLRAERHARAALRERRRAGRHDAVHELCAPPEGRARRAPPPRDRRRPPKDSTASLSGRHIVAVVADTHAAAR